jgi:hypothetical protein
MSDDAGGLHNRQAPRNRPGEVRVADLTLLVRVPGQPAAVRAYTDEERYEAERYVSQTGGTRVPLPLSPPVGYIPGPDGTLVPTREAGEDLAPP